MWRVSTSGSVLRRLHKHIACASNFVFAFLASPNQVIKHCMLQHADEVVAAWLPSSACLIADL